MSQVLPDSESVAGPLREEMKIMLQLALGIYQEPR